MRRETVALILLALISVMVGLIGVELGVGEVLNDWLTR